MVREEAISLTMLVVAVILLSSYNIKAVNSYNSWWCSSCSDHDHVVDDYCCLSWRVAVEANNIGPWRTVPPQCCSVIKSYMIDGQYQRDLNLIVDNICTYINDLLLLLFVGDGLDAWILDVDDTCISNLLYYSSVKQRYGCEPFDPVGFTAWASRGECPANLHVLRLFHKLLDSGFKVFLVTGRSEETLGQVTADNLRDQGFIGYHRLILRSGAYKGQSAIAYKSEIRKQLVGQGYRIWGNVGDQWSDLQGDYTGNRTFKLPNPMYFVP